MKNHQVRFRFLDATELVFSFNLTVENLEAVTIEIAHTMGKRAMMVKAAYAKYFKKRNVMSHRKFYIDFLINGKEVLTEMYNVETSNKLTSDFDALRILLSDIFFDHIQTEKTYIKQEIAAILN